MLDVTKRIASLVVVHSVVASSPLIDNACLGVKAVYRSLSCCPLSAVNDSFGGPLQASYDGRDFLAQVRVPPFRGVICVENGASTPTFDIGAGDAKTFYDFWKVPGGNGSGTWLAHYPWLNGSKFYARKAASPVEKSLYLWLQEEWESALPKPLLCDPSAEAFSKFTRIAYDMEHAANVRPNYVDGTLGCYIFRSLGPPYVDHIPSYCTEPRLTKDVADRPLNLDPVAISRFVAGAMAGPKIADPYTAPYVYFTTLSQGVSMMHASFAYAEAAKIYPGAFYPDKICGTYTGPSVPACALAPDAIATGVEVCLYKDYDATPGTNETTGERFFRAMWACGAGGASGMVPYIAIARVEKDEH